MKKKNKHKKKDWRSIKLDTPKQFKPDSKAFISRYAGTLCKDCRETIQIGELVRFKAGVIAHNDCYADKKVKELEQIPVVRIRIKQPEITEEQWEIEQNYLDWKSKIK